MDPNAPTELFDALHQRVTQELSAPVTSSTHLASVVTIILLAGGISLVLRRIGRATIASRLRRWLPLLYTLVWGTAVLVVTLIYAHGLSSSWFLAIWIVFLVVIFASVGWLRSVIAGMALSIEGRIAVGDSIRVDGTTGEVVGFGMRAMRLRGGDGTIYEIPNERLMTETVANLTSGSGESPCEITVAIPPDFDPDRALDVARTIAVLSPLASPRHRPEAFLSSNDDEHYEVRVRGFAFDAAYQDHFRSDVVARLQDAFANHVEPGHDERLLLVPD